MSMKRSKEATRGKGREVEGDGFWSKKTPERVWEWEKDVSAQPDESFTAYSPSNKFAVEALLTHPKFGKGVVIDVEPQRVEVLFQDGPKKLAHGLTG